MQNRYNKARSHTIKQDRSKGTKHERAYQENTEGKLRVTTPILCRDCKHTINHNSQCYQKPHMPCSIQHHETPTIAPTTRLSMILADSNLWLTKCSHQIKTNNFKNPTKISYPLNQKLPPQTTLINCEKGDWNVH